MSSALIRVVALLALTASSGAFLVANRPQNGGFIYERVPDSRLPMDLRIDTEAVNGVASPVATTQALMNQWNAVPGTRQVFGSAVPGGPYNGSTAKQTFGVFTNTNYEVAFDGDGSILAEYGLASGVLGITLKIVNGRNAEILDVLIIINTQPGALTPPAGSGATRADLFRGTLLHELGHVVGIGHTAVGMTSSASDGLLPATPAQIPTLFPFRLPIRPQEGNTLELDDEAALRFRYADAVIQRGSISGRVRALSGASINQIAVRAVSVAGSGSGSRISHVGALTDVDGRGLGRYTIPGLPAGAYRVLIETVNGRGGVGAQSLAGAAGSLGSDPFVLAVDELWQRGDTYDPAIDDARVSTPVQVRSERDTAGIDFLLNARPILDGQTLSGALGNGDARVPDDGNGTLHHTDLFVFQGSVGQRVSLRVDGVGFTPQIGIFRPSNLAREALAEPNFGSSASLTHTLEQSGVYTIGVAARGLAGTSAGSGAYSLRLTGSGLSLAPAATVRPPRIEPLPGSLVDRSVGSPSCDVAIVGLRAVAGSHEELWIDRLSVRGSGTGNERDHLSAVRLVLDRNGNGRFDSGEPVVGSTTFGANDGVATFNDLDLVVRTGAQETLLVTYTVDVPALASAPAGLSAWWASLLLLPLLLVRRQAHAAALLALVMLPLACGGGGGGDGPAPPCLTPFSVDAGSVNFEAEVRSSDIVAFSSVGEPPVALTDLLAAPVISGTLTVSRAG